ncbi:hypothetical protein WG66_013578, partial [Moniliophthora roreri]
MLKARQLLINLLATPCVNGLILRQGSRDLSKRSLVPNFLEFLSSHPGLAIETPKAPRHLTLPVWNSSSPPGPLDMSPVFRYHFPTSSPMDTCIFRAEIASFVREENDDQIASGHKEKVQWCSNDGGTHGEQPQEADSSGAVEKTEGFLESKEELERQDTCR